MSKTVAEKLRLLPGTRGLLLDPPPGYVDTLGPQVSVDTRPGSAPYDVVQLFVTTGAGLHARLADARAALGPVGILWITYPKLTSKAAGELSRDVLFELMRGQGFRAVAQVAVDETWSAMRFKPL